MNNIPKELSYTQTHEWVRKESDGTYTVGITDHAQHALGDLVHVELPEVGSSINLGDETVVLESVKAAADVYAPLSGTVIAINDALGDTPELINNDPYGEGWLFRLTLTNNDELRKLLNADDYSKKLSE